MKNAIKKHNIIFIAPYKELAVFAEKAKKEAKLDFEIRVGSLPYSLEVVGRELENGLDVVITRGGNALKIRKEFDIPVVEIQVTVFDIIKALNKAKGYGNRIGIIGFPNIIYGASSLSSIINREIIEIHINGIEECSTAIENAKAMGVNILVGDRIAVETAISSGMKGELIVSNSYEGIVNSYYEAIKIAEVRKKELAKTEQMKIVTEFTHSGIIAIDKEGIITLFNAKASKILGINGNIALEKSIDQYLPQFKLKKIVESKKKILNEFIQLNNTCIVVQKIPVLIENEAVGAVATFHMLEYIQQIEEKARSEIYRRGYVAKHIFSDIVGKSDKIQGIIEKAANYAMVDSAILITGETGVGKEVFSQSIHNYSLRKNGPFVAVNCAALPYNLLESELFGYVKGAFTGAKDEGKKGLFEQAHGGTIFLDEIGEIPLPIQARLLRVLQEGQIQRIGDNKIVSVDVRIICATNKNLNEMIKEKEFREDLYYRINVLNIEIPPLRDRIDDIPILLKYFIEKISRKYQKKILCIEDPVLYKLCQSPWPGNIRQLMNTCERLVVECKKENIDMETYLTVMGNIECDEERTLHLETIVTKTIRKALDMSGNNKSLAAKMLGIDRSTLWRRMQNID